MHNSDKVIVGIIIFILFFAMPFWLNFGKAKALPKPELPTDTKECVESKEYMRAYHMKMLLDWRDKKVREGQVYYINSKGKYFKISLQNTCLKCHKSCIACHPGVERFCDLCHNTVSAHPDCWKCHFVPEEVKKWQ
jgi:hypothetical protein